MNFSVVIPTYNRTECLRETLLSILPVRCDIEKIILVDQSRPEIAAKVTSLTAELTKQFAPCELVLIRSEIPSLTAARNLGMKHSSGEWVIFCDDDVVWPTEIIEEIKRVIETERDIVLVGGLNYEGAGNTYSDAVKKITSTPPKSFAGRFLRWIIGRSGLSATRGHVSHGVFGSFPSDMRGLRETEWAMGFFFAVHRKFVMGEKLEFDEKLAKYAYAEDLDFTYRLFRAAAPLGKRCVFSPKIGVWHKASQEFRFGQTWLEYALFMNRIYIGKKVFRSRISRLCFLAKMLLAEIYNFGLSFKKRTWQAFLNAHLEYFMHNTRINREGWYFLLEKR